ncbi:phospholipase D zeta 1-like isoform X2 [Nymphaea colorata]|uniref:phospholipase D zeta 1-like isoform X2 n=1 Tax=Nymphaea colorata TaxID=210225 RepID=UPI00129EA923|nr:phospholipase D zeta 1-like isoform X2 [Nymphaea colorata]
MSEESSDRFIFGDGAHDYFPMPSETPLAASSRYSFLWGPEPTWIFDELPKATVLSISQPDASDITPALLTYTIEFQYKQFKWQLVKKASQVFFLHFALKKRAIIEEFHEKQEQAKEWLQNLGIGEQIVVAQDEDEADYVAAALPHEENYVNRNRNVPSRAALPMIKPALGRERSISDRAKVAMQGYLNHFLGNMDIVNSREVCRFLEVSTLSFLPEYGHKLKEDYVMVKHLPNIQKDVSSCCCLCPLFDCCNSNWQKVWAVLKPGFLAFLEDPFEDKLLDIVVFDVLPPSDGNGGTRVSLAEDTKEKNPLRCGFTVSCGTRTLKLRTSNKAKVHDWVVSVNDAALRPPEGWCYPHRFGAFAPLRGLNEDGSQAQWFIDGKAAFEAIASSIEGAKSEIFITGWWLCPELYLRRPFSVHDSSRLDVLLEEKAKQGVQIYILLYKEVPLALKINSVYSKRRLLSIHENVKVLRYPDHFSTGIYLWSHHEKIVIVDYQICYIGGLDLCFGRYDNPQHEVNDFPARIWPGKDYYNPRESEPNCWEDTMKDELDREKYPRMPWHDVHCALWGPPCRDVARHFVQRWNYAKRNKAPNEQAIPLLIPQHHMVIPHYMGKDSAIDLKPKQHENCGLKCQYSAASRTSVQDVPLLLPKEADRKDIAIGDTKGNELRISPDVIDQRMVSSWSHVFSYRKSKVDHGPDMQMEGFVNDHGTKRIQGKPLIDTSKQQNDEWWDTQERLTFDTPTNEATQVGPCCSCRCQVVRSVGQWSAGTSQTEESIHNAYCAIIEKSEHFIYIENQFFISGLSGDDIIHNRVLEALYRRVLRAYNEKKSFRVIVVVPLLPGFQGGIDDGGAATVRALMHWQYRTICRGQSSILKNLHDIIGPKTDDYISFYGLRSYGRLGDHGPLATSQVYVHSKLMIVDDRAVLVGSANINDRSLLGCRDSEIGILIEDKEFVGSCMNGSPWRAGKFAYSLRMSLWYEHLGLHPTEMSRICDPVIEATYKDIWMATAKTNTIIYQDVFACIPNDRIHSRTALRQAMGYWKEKIGHTTIDLGISPERLESYQNGDARAIDPMEKLQSVKGFLVSYPLDFMCQEDLRPVFNETEFYASPQVFH